MKGKVSKAPAKTSRLRRGIAEVKAVRPDRIKALLQKTYSDVLHEPIPARLLQLFQQTDKKENDP